MIGLVAAAARTAFGFLKGNWTWAVPAVVAGLAIGWALVERADYYACSAARSEDKAAQAQAIAAAEAKVRKALQADQEFSNKLVADYAGEIAQLQGGLQNALLGQERAVATPSCDRTPAADAFDRGLSDLDREAGAGQPDAAGRAGDAVPAPARAPVRLPKRAGAIRLGVARARRGCPVPRAIGQAGRLDGSSSGGVGA